MKTLMLKLALSLLVVSSAGAQASDPNLWLYGVGKTRGYVQTSAAIVQADYYSFTAFVYTAEGGVLNSASIQGPGNYFGVNGSQELTLTDFGAEFVSTVRGSEGQFNTAFPEDNKGNYSLRIDTGALGGQIAGGYDHSISLKLGSPAYVTDIPTVTIDNGLWIGGSFQANVENAENPINVSWNFASFSPQSDYVRFIVRSEDGSQILVNQVYRRSNPGSFTIDSSLLTMGQSYVGQLTFMRVVDSPNAVPGVQGIAYYGMETQFSLHAVPEPSTYALLALGLGVVLVPVLRRRLRR